MSSSQFPWRDGFWKIKDMTAFLYVIEGENVEMKNLYSLDHPSTRCYMKSKLVSGDFGPTTQEIYEMTGVDTYNVQWEMEEWNMKTPAVLSKGGTCIHKKSFGRPAIDVMEYLDKARLEALKEDREPEDAPSLPSYIKPTPEHMGKILWFCGPPGAGKSTTAQLMGRYHRYVYYEADCFNFCVNPFIDLHVPNPSVFQVKQKTLKGRNIEVIKAVENTTGMFEAMKNGMFDQLEEIMDPCLDAMTKNIAQQRQRIGGDWSVAWACFSRTQRDKLRQILGSDLVIIILKVTMECLRKRLAARHGGGTENFVELIAKMHQLYEDAGDDEMNTYNLDVNEKMSEDDVVAEVLKIVKK